MFLFITSHHLADLSVSRFDEDLIVNSKKPIETVVKVGYSIGTTPTKNAA